MAKTATEIRTQKTWLTEADRIVHTSDAVYGHPKDNFKVEADMLNAFYQHRVLQEPLHFNSIDISVMHIVQKLARIAKAPQHEDSWRDIAGYVACANRIIKGE